MISRSLLGKKIKKIPSVGGWRFWINKQRNGGESPPVASQRTSSSCLWGGRSIFSNFHHREDVVVASSLRRRRVVIASGKRILIERTHARTHARTRASCVMVFMRYLQTSRRIDSGPWVRVSHHVRVRSSRLRHMSKRVWDIGCREFTRYHSNRGVSAVSRCAADLEIAERL